MRQANSGPNLITIQMPVAQDYIHMGTQVAPLNTRLSNTTLKYMHRRCFEYRIDVLPLFKFQVDKGLPGNQRSQSGTG